MKARRPTQRSWTIRGCRTDSKVDVIGESSSVRFGTTHSLEISLDTVKTRKLRIKTSTTVTASLIETIFRSHNAHNMFRKLLYDDWNEYLLVQ